MPKRQHPEPPPLAAIVAELVARAERGPPPAWKPDDATPMPCYRLRHYKPVHPGQLPFRFPEEETDGTA
jgi:hypothetical protein